MQIGQLLEEDALDDSNDEDGGSISAGKLQGFGEGHFRDEEMMEIDTNVRSVREIARLRHSPQLRDIIDEIHRLKLTPRRSEVVGPVEADPEYALIVSANNILVEIENDLSIIHKFARDHYAKRFPELESLVPGAADYLLTVQEIGNDLAKVKNSDRLNQILTPATVMVVSISASTSQGEPLSPSEMERVFEACEMAQQLNDMKTEVFDFVESRMSLIAPNLSVLVGASVAAKLMGIAGGLTKLSKMPACNIQVLGASKKTSTGFSATAMLPHTGFIFYSEHVQNYPSDLRRKAAKLLAAKCALAARVDAFHESRDGSAGEEFRADIEKKLDKLQEPPPIKTVKPLAAPIDIPRKKRGGRRVRRMKERYAITELRKQQNRMTFGEIEEDAYQDDLGFSAGQAGKKGVAGRIRTAQVDEKTKVRISKTLHKNLQRQQVYGGATTVRRHVSGTASSVAFTPLQGLEIVNPNAAESTKSQDGKYFSNNAGFLNVNNSQHK
ncbi:U4/U6 small nuclear ribonucleoprotein Prp31-like isoform X2 [Varroa jacobsoni]|nr:U4/U6 small nuclear ribonucleoprotein Prp31-like isoform X2 [Varroa destructor]XP_022664345.1 U4/U6 small nuclear ribonucleoprotein Prp31-like isoform X2 [Varroa destructor]XP_022711831.1 U4/U6 small nuclear ribonucleoprotein Prp31-like isoform X2 [Varroa jacobsoni]